MPRHPRPALTFCYETGCRTGAMAKVNLAMSKACHAGSVPPGILKNRKPLIVPLSNELVAMLKKKFKGNGPVFEDKELPARVHQGMR
jgi:integrase